MKTESRSIVQEFIVARLPLRAMIVAASVAAASSAFAGSQNPAGLVVDTERVVTIKTTQEKVYEFTNPSSNTAPFSRELKSKSSFEASSTMESLRDATRTDKFKVASEVSFEYSGAKGSASASADFEKVVRTFLKTTGESKRNEEEERSTSLKLDLAPNEGITIYRTTTYGDGYVHQYETNVPMTPAVQETKVTVSVRTDLTPVFNALLDTVTSSATGISTDSGEWGSYAKLCSDARVHGGLPLYVARVKSDLWTTGLDQGSWAAVKQAAEKAEIALAQGQQKEALLYVLKGFDNVRNPSHNSWAWDNCRNVGRTWLTSN